VDDSPALIETFQAFFLEDCCPSTTAVRAQDGLTRVWNGAEYRAFRARLASDDPPDVCRTCAVYNHTF
jgi:hypothetical protein